MSWDNEVEGWRNRADAEAALAAAKEHAPRSEAVLLKLVEGCWTDLDDDGEAEAYEVQDGSGAFVLWPDSEADADEEDDEIVEPVPGFVWIFCR
jgi:hypothetical protein